MQDEDSRLTRHSHKLIQITKQTLSFLNLIPSELFGTAPTTTSTEEPEGVHKIPQDESFFGERIKSHKSFLFKKMLQYVALS